MIKPLALATAAFGLLAAPVQAQEKTEAVELTRGEAELAELTKSHTCKPGCSGWKFHYSGGKSGDERLTKGECNEEQNHLLR